MFPGDMIEWAYTANDKVVRKDEELWSSTMIQWVPIGHPALLVHVDEHTYSWLTPKGLFHARVDDTPRWLVPRAARPRLFHELINLE
jgi:hypothetical protein